MAAQRASASALISMSPPEPLPQLPASILGVVVDCEAAVGPRVDYPGNPCGPVVAQLMVAATATTMEQAIAKRTPVALVFENGDPARPLIFGFAHTVETAPEARVDGRRVVLTGEEEIELRCGAASICLKRNGRVVIRGATIETRAKGTNRIKGGSVQIN